MSHKIFLSDRSKQAVALENPAIENLIDFYANPWSPDNASGYINMSTADNNLSGGIVQKKLKKDCTSDNIIEEGKLFGYPPPGGMPHTLSTFANFIGKYFNAEMPISTEHLCTAPGVSGAFDIIAFTLCNPFDVILTASPFYCRILNDFGERGQAKVEAISMINQDGTFDLTVDKVSKAYEKATANGERVRALLLVNPNNPLGTIQDPEEILKILEFAKSKEIVVIMNEIYALSTFDPSTNFRSILSYFSKLPDPARTIWLWGVSKDFCVPGLRYSLMYSQDESLIEALRRIELLQPTSPLSEAVACKLVSDNPWVDNFINTNKNNLRKAFNFASEYLTNIGIPHAKAQAGFFITCDFRKYLTAKTFEAEGELEAKFRANGVVLIRGEWERAAEPGWFRIVFTGPPGTLEQGLKRIEKTIEHI